MHLTISRPLLKPKTLTKSLRIYFELEYIPTFIIKLKIIFYQTENNIIINNVDLTLMILENNKSSQLLN